MTQKPPFEALSVETLAARLGANEALCSRIGKDTSRWKVREVGDGNLNLESAPAEVEVDLDGDGVPESFEAPEFFPGTFVTRPSPTRLADSRHRTRARRGGSASSPCGA